MFLPELRPVFAWPGPRCAPALTAGLFFGFFAWSTLDYHEHRDNVLSSDAAGYYIYLPGVLHYGFRASAVDEGTRAYAGKGFDLDPATDRIVTKYPYGTALFELPFYAAAELLAPPGEGQWGRSHHRAIVLSGCFYWTLGLVFLGSALQRWWRSPLWMILLVLGCVAFGTNTFYAGFRQPGFSHAVSFFLVALALHIVWRDRDTPLRSGEQWTFAFACGALVIVRTFDAVLVVFLCLLLLDRRRELLRSWRWYARMGAVLVVLAGPQLAYWSFVHGTPIVYTYGQEGFDHWASPRVTEVLLAPENGLLPHAPVLVLVPFGLAALWTRAKALVLLITGTFILAIYSFGAWHAWHFGCSYGMRPFVQFTPLAAMPLLALFTWSYAHARALLHGLLPLIGLLCFMNYRAMLQYEGCFNGDSWDWLRFSENLVDAFFGGVGLVEQ